MPIKGQSVTISFVAWDAPNNGGKTGDSGNIILRWVKDGIPSAPTNAVAEVDAINTPGVYIITLTNNEASCDIGTLAGKSSTPGVAIIPVTITFDQIQTPPTVSQISTQVGADLSAAHGAGAWDGGITAVDIDTALTASHGAGAWTQPIIPIPPTAVQISTQVGNDLSAAHGAGSWATAIIPAYPVPPTAIQISTQVGNDLSTTHGAGSWLTGTGGGTVNAPTTSEISTQVGIDLAAAHGAGSWLTGTDSGTGSGSVAVDHNTGGVDALRYESAPEVGIDAAEVRAYYRVDYDAGFRTPAYCIARTRTGPDGRWVAPLHLDPGLYVISISAVGYKTNTINITV